MRILTVIATSALLAAPALAQTPEDEAAVRSVADQLMATWAAGDADGFVGLFTENADFMAGGGVRMTGRDAIWDLHAGAFQGIYAGSTFPVTVDHVTFITPDVAMIALKGRVEPAEGKEPAGIQGQDLIGTAIVRQDADGWRIAYMNTMPAAAADFQPPSAARQAAE